MVVVANINFSLVLSCLRSLQTSLVLQPHKLFMIFKSEEKPGHSNKQYYYRLNWRVIILKYSLPKGKHKHNISDLVVKIVLPISNRENKIGGHQFHPN